jgi:hypothetical protein
MSTGLHRTVRLWLESELAAREDEADERFRAVARGFETKVVPAGFTAAVLARLARPAPARDAFRSWWTRAAIAASVLLVGGLAALTPWHVWAEALVASVQGVAWGCGRLLTGAEAWVAAAVGLWAGLGDAATVVARQLTAPLPLALLTLNFVIAAGAFGALRRLMALQEN